MDIIDGMTRVPFALNLFADETGRIVRESKYKGMVQAKRDGGGDYITIAYTDLKGDSKTTGAHRIIARTFIANQDAKKYVNHRNGISDDNRASNLEWVTCSENIQHSRSVLGGGVKGRRSTLSIDEINENLVKWDNGEFPVKKEARKNTGKHSMTIEPSEDVHSALVTLGNINNRKPKQIAEYAIEQYLIRKSVLKRKS